MSERLKRMFVRPARLFAMAVALMLVVPGMFLASAQRTGPKKVTRPVPGRKMISPQIPSADRMQADKVFLEYADRLSYKEDPSMSREDQYQIVSGNVKLRKGGTYMFCDSAYVYEKINSVEAFGNVRIEQGDTLFVYADYLDYNGLDQEAVLYADAGKKVRLRNRDVTLTTDVFHYDLEGGVGFYDVGGELVDRKNKLTSWEGEYYSRTKQSYFTGDVRLESRGKNDVLYINTDSLEYNTHTHIAKLVSRSVIRNRDGVIVTYSGVYNTNTGVADLYERSTVRTNRGNTLTGDTLVYNRTKQRGWAYGNMVLVDSARKSTLYGDYGYYDEVRDSAFVTGRALAKEYSKGDTLYLHGDSIEAYVDLTDSTKVTNVYHKVRFYRSDLQGLCDSLSLTERDSMMWMYRAPIVWSGERQILGNQINVHVADSTVDWARLPRTGLMAEHIAEDCYNQLSGDDMTVWMNDSTVRRLYTEGSVQLIVFPMESDSTYNKYAFVESSYMDAYFNNNEVESIHFWPETTSKITPLYLAKRSSYFLPKFRWYEDLRPISPEDVFYVPEGMMVLLNAAPPIEPGPDGPGGPKQEKGAPNENAPADRKRLPPAAVDEATLPEDGEQPLPAHISLPGGSDGTSPASLQRPGGDTSAGKSIPIKRERTPRR